MDSDGLGGEGQMMATKPVIGITVGSTVKHLSYATVRRFSVTAEYASAVAQAGGMPLLLPPQPDNVHQLLNLLDGLLLTGGGDIRPSRFGEQTLHPTTYGIDDERDEFEIELVVRAIERDLPLLGICRGIQTLNVALGGTLFQDIADQHATEIKHDQEKLGIAADTPSHEATAEPGSLLERVYGATEIAVNSFHHQAVRRLAEGLVPTAISSDGVVEAVELPRCSWLLAVQWHPELMFRAQPQHLRPFASLVQAAYHQSAIAAG